jgi:hypothetical protein
MRSTWFSSERLELGLKGCLAASLCYIIYGAVDWPEISTSVTTCLLTALTTSGASRQKQVLRFAGALIGGYVFGTGAQVLILPYIDSIAAFAVLFIAVATAAAWVTTSSPRLSYCGMQIAFAFFLINLQGIQDTDVADGGARSGGRHLTRAWPPSYGAGSTCTSTSATQSKVSITRRRTWCATSCDWRTVISGSTSRCRSTW